MLRRFTSSSPASSLSYCSAASSATAEHLSSQRYSAYLLTSYYKRFVNPYANVQPKYLVRGGGFRSVVKSAGYAVPSSSLSSSAAAAAAAASESNAESTKELQEDSNSSNNNGVVVEWPWYGGVSSTAIEDIAAPDGANKDEFEGGGLLEKNKANLARRAYVPLADVLRIEMRGDHLISGGLFSDALKHFGVCAKAKQITYPEPHHLENVKIRIKLARAFRLCGDAKSAIANLETCIGHMERLSTQGNPRNGRESAMPISSVSAGGTTGSSSSSSSDNNSSKTTASSLLHLPSAEHYCEVFLELGLAKRDQGELAEAGTLLEDVVRLMDAYHDIGGSHRGLRLISRSVKNFNLNFQSKLPYHAPRDWDRTFALTDSALEEAETVYRTAGDKHGIARVLETRARIMDTKTFNSVYLSGRIRSWRGHNHRKHGYNTSAPSATELLAYSPTVHQVYHDFSRSSIAPLGREDEVQMPPGTRVLDDGDPYRHLREASKGRVQKQRQTMEFLTRRDAKIVDDNTIPQ